MLKPQIKVNQEKAPALSWGLGFGLQDVNNERAFWHWGDNGDTKSFMIASTRSKNAILFFTNSSNGLSFAKEVLDYGIGGENPSLGWLNYERFDSPSRILLKEIADKDAVTALKNYRERRKNKGKNTLSESQMNRLGYSLMFLKRTEDAIKVFEQNTSDFPESANVWDSLAEAYMRNGDKALAIKFYEKSLSLDPKNEGARKNIIKLKGN